MKLFLPYNVFRMLNMGKVFKNKLCGKKGVSLKLTRVRKANVGKASKAKICIR